MLMTPPAGAAVSASPLVGQTRRRSSAHYSNRHHNIEGSGSGSSGGSKSNSSRNGRRNKNDGNAITSADLYFKGHRRRRLFRTRWKKLVNNYISILWPVAAVFLFLILKFSHRGGGGGGGGGFISIHTTNNNANWQPTTKSAVLPFASGRRRRGGGGDSDEFGPITTSRDTHVADPHLHLRKSSTSRTTTADDAAAAAAAAVDYVATLHHAEIYNKEKNRKNNNQNHNKKPNYGGLKIRHVGSGGELPVRKIHPRDDGRYEKERHKFLKEIDSPDSLEEDVDENEPGRFDHFDEVEYDDESEDWYYRPGPWSYATYPVCNSFHELNILQPTTFSTDNVRQSNNKDNANITLVSPYYLDHGHFRESYMFRDGKGNDDAALKISRLFEERNFRQYDYTQTQMEALVMLQTHSSKLTMDIYGLCGTSILVEPGDDGLEDEIMPNDYAFVKQEDLDKYNDAHGGVQPQNKFTPEEKLELALAMAEGLAELHGNREGMIISHDLGLDQYLVSYKDGLLKMNDFNKARVLPWNRAKQKYGKVWSFQAYSFRAPEENSGGWINDGSDTLSLGKMYHCLLTGLRPYYYKLEEEKASQAVGDGEYPWVDPRYKTERSYIESRLVEIMERMWQYEIEDRPSIFEVIEHLRETARVAGVEARGRWRQ